MLRLYPSRGPKSAIKANARLNFGRAARIAGGDVFRYLESPWPDFFLHCAFVFPYRLGWRAKIRLSLPRRNFDGRILHSRRVRRPRRDHASTFPSETKLDARSKPSLVDVDLCRQRGFIFETGKRRQPL